MCPIPSMGPRSPGLQVSWSPGLHWMHSESYLGAKYFSTANYQQTILRAGVYLLVVVQCDTYCHASHLKIHPIAEQHVPISQEA